MTVAPPRPAVQRWADTLARLASDVDAWVSTATGDGPYLVPLSFLFDGTDFWLSTSSRAPTVRYVRAVPRVRLGIGPTRDVVLVEGGVTVEPATGVSETVGEAFAVKAGFDPRPLPGYVFLRVRPERIMAWREENELAGRDLMRDGRWLV